MIKTTPQKLGHKILLSKVYKRYYRLSVDVSDVYDWGVPTIWQCAAVYA